jgi:SAM-dependent methyltransferase
MSYYVRKHYRLKTAEEGFMDRLLFLEHLGENRPGPQLDIGCSIGNFLNIDPGRIEGVDLDPEALKICAERGLRCQNLDIVRDEMPWKDHFEVVYARHVMEHLEDPLTVARKIRGILKVGGIFVVETPDYLIAHHRKKSNFWDDYTHKRPFTRNALERLAFDAGFEVIHGGGKPNYGYWTKQCIRRGWIRHASAFKWHLRLGLVGGDLLFSLRRPD